jgi:tripartite-type tricarboxylate transporter receptor subunit TctC
MLATLPMVKTGKLKVIAVSSKARTPLLPTVPTIAEQGVPNFESGTYQGVMAPAKMPKENVAKLNAELVKIIRSQAMKDKLQEMGADILTLDAAQTTDFVAKEPHAVGGGHQAGQRQYRRARLTGGTNPASS